MQIEYVDGDKEDLIIPNEKVKFHLSRAEMERLNLKFSVNSADTDGNDYNEMVVLAASLDDCQEFEAGDIIWAKLTGMQHPLGTCILMSIIFSYVHSHGLPGTSFG